MRDDELMHYGTPRHSGRYPWGSGDDPYQRSSNFLGHISELRKAGLSQLEIARSMNMNTRQLRDRITLATVERDRELVIKARKLHDKGYSNSGIGRVLNKNESSVRALLDEALAERRNAIFKNAEILKQAVAEKRFIDVSKGTELEMGITATKLKSTLAYLRAEGYEIHQVPIRQMGTGKDTNVLVLAAPGTEWKEVAQNKESIKLLNDVYSEDGGRTMRHLSPPIAIDPSRVKVRYYEDGGREKDGVIELRRGVDDISLGDAQYAQVRIAVGGTHYLKGMAMHTDDIPDGYDIVFNTSKHEGTPMLGPKDNTVLKPVGKDTDNPFGATIRDDDQLIRAQRHYIDADGKEQQSALNIVSEEGTWETWSKGLSSQMLSKQNYSLAKKQLDLAADISREEFETIMAYTNPVIRQDLLLKFADQCDKDAEILKAAPLPGQTNKVILPVTSLPDTQVYAPGYDNGETVALIRHPHGGIFEIPILTVNNNNHEGKRNLGNSLDAIGINPKVAERLSGADFDGDHVVVIPIRNISIKTAPQLKGLEEFDPKEQYPKREGMKIMQDTPMDKGVHMGKISNLITDMTLGGANLDEIAQAVRHSMVVIDAAKHELDFERSFEENGIAQLSRVYQGKATGGSATLISRSRSPVYVDERKEKAPSKMTPEEKKRWEDGEKVYENTNRTLFKSFVNKDGDTSYQRVSRQEVSTRMKESADAKELLSPNPSRMELLYADYANTMKAMAKEARREARRSEDFTTSPSAKIAYKAEVDSLKAALNVAMKNARYETQAQILAGASYKMKKQQDPSLTKEQLKKLRFHEIEDARKRVGAKKKTIYITDREWEAINAGAVSKTTLRSIIANADPKRVKELATPRERSGISPAQVARAKSMMKNGGYTQKEVARFLGISVSSLVKAIK